MAGPIVQFTMGDEKFTFAHLSVQEMVKVKSWTTYKNRDEWFNALRAEDPEAQIAAYVLVQHRKGNNIRFGEADFDLDTFSAQWVDPATGRQVTPVLEKDSDGTLKTNKDGMFIPVLDASGNEQWTYVDTGDPVPPTGTADSPTSSATPEQPGSDSASPSSTPLSESA